RHEVVGVGPARELELVRQAHVGGAGGGGPRRRRHGDQRRPEGGPPHPVNRGDTFRTACAQRWKASRSVLVRGAVLTRNETPAVTRCTPVLSLLGTMRVDQRLPEVGERSVAIRLPSS